MSTERTTPGHAVGYAPFWKRAVALLLDLLVAVALYSALIHTLNLLLDLPVEYSPILERGLSLEMTPYVEENFLAIVALYSLSKLLILYPYFAVLESSRLQATLGKLALGIRVTDLSGGRVTFFRATGRFLGKILSAQTLLLGYVMALFTKRRQALHDLMAGTLVVNRGPTRDPRSPRPGHYNDDPPSSVPLE